MLFSVSKRKRKTNKFLEIIWKQKWLLYYLINNQELFWNTYFFRDFWYWNETKRLASERQFINQNVLFSKIRILIFNWKSYSFSHEFIRSDVDFRYVVQLHHIIDNDAILSRVHPFYELWLGLRTLSRVPHTILVLCTFLSSLLGLRDQFCSKLLFIQ